jgi:hypothetical protein
VHKALPNLRGSLDKVRAIANDIDSQAQDALRDPMIQARHETTLCAATVILSGFFESFLRELAEEVIGDICNRGIPFDQLPSKIRVAHYGEGALYLQKMARDEKKEDPIILAKAADAARRLASVGGPLMPYELLWEAFADTQANPGPDQVSTFLRRFHIDQPLPTLAAAMNTSENNLILRLKSFIEIRNECAHNGMAASVPTTNDALGFCDLVEEIGQGIVAVFQNTLGQPPYVAQAAPQIAP